MTAHSQAPWGWASLAGETVLCGGDKDGTFILRLNRKSMRDIPFSDADKRLIAAAPDLLAACETALEVFKDIFEPCEPDCDCIIHTLKSAIVKATGEQAVAQ